MAELDQQFIEYVVKNLVDHPDDVKIERTIDDRGVLLELTVNEEDMGRIIGKAGSTAKAIRTLLRVVGAKTDERLNLKIVDVGGENEGDVAVADATPEEVADEVEASVAEEVPETDMVSQEEVAPAESKSEVASSAAVPQPDEEPGEAVSLEELGATEEDLEPVTADESTAVAAPQTKASKDVEEA